MSSCLENSRVSSGCLRRLLKILNALHFVSCDDDGGSLATLVSMMGVGLARRS